MEESAKKIDTVKNLLKSHNIIINYWSRQSGKTMVGASIALDYLLLKQNVLVIAPCSIFNLIL